MALRTSHLILFGTPSGRLRKAQLGRWLKRQIRDMWVGSAFLQDLRARWVQPPSDCRVGRLLVVAADRDEFVNEHASQAPFEREVHEVVHGDHLSMVKPQHPGYPSAVLVVRALAGVNHLRGAADAALAAIELNTFRRHVHDWIDHADDLDKNAIVTLALSLEELGEHGPALQLLEAHAQKVLGQFPRRPGG